MQVVLAALRKGKSEALRKKSVAYCTMNPDDMEHEDHGGDGNPVVIPCLVRDTSAWLRS